MSHDPETTYIVGALAEDTKDQFIRGTRTLQCEMCNRPTLFCPSSLNRPEAAGATFICMRCAGVVAETVDSFRVGMFTDEQMQELVDAMRSQ